MKRTLLSAAILLLAPIALSAQSAPADAALASMRDNWKGVTGNITRSADMVAEADYAYRPVATVRTFGQLIAHIAGAQFSMCAAALGEKPRDEGEIEKSVTTKAGLVKALRESTEYCQRAYTPTAAAAAATTSLYGDNVPRYNALALNLVHNGEHYGNIITYLRMKGLVPPSSQR